MIAPKIMSNTQIIVSLSYCLLFLSVANFFYRQDYNFVMLFILLTFFGLLIISSQMINLIVKDTLEEIREEASRAEIVCDEFECFRIDEKYREKPKNKE